MISPVMKYVDRPQPKSGLDGKFSLQYTHAAALLDGAVRIDSFSDERRFRADMVELLKKIELVQDQSIPGDFHSMYLDSEVELEDGARHSVRCRAPRGSWGVKMDPREHEEKLRDCLEHSPLGKAEGERLLKELDRLETLDGEAVQSVIALLAPRGSNAHGAKLLDS
jgi:aconitate decarboxylase